MKARRVAVAVPLVTSTYSLDEINAGYQDMHAGRNIRGVIDFTAGGA